MDLEESELHEKSALSLFNAKKQGYLTKEGGKGLKKNKKKRWFILHDLHLYYYVSDGALKPQGVIRLTEYKECTIVEDASTKFTFKITPKADDEMKNKRTYFMFASDQNERDEWVQAISETIQAAAQTRYKLGESRFESTCFIKVSEAKFHDQLERDIYCTILADNFQKIRTPTVFHSFKPAFDQEYEFDLAADSYYICVQLRDAKKKTDNLIGQAKVTSDQLKDQKVHDSWFKVISQQPSEEQLIPCGDIVLSCKKKENERSITVHEVRNVKPPAFLSSSTLGLSVLFRSAQKKYRTSVVTGSDVFSWTTDNTFVMPGEDAITVGVWYEGEELGVVPISPEQWNGEGEPRVLTLQGRRMDTKEIGEVHLALHKQDAAILPDKNYYDLLKTLVTHLSLIDKLVAVSNKKEKPIAECLVKAFEMGRSAVHYIKHVTKTEIDETPNPSIIFRGNTVATKSVDMYMRLVGTPYLHLVMKPILLNIINNGKDKKKSCEVDPTRLEDRDDKRSKICSRNCGNLLGYVTQIFEAIKSTFKSYPTNFRIIFEHIKTTVRNRFSEDADGQVASLRAVAGFVFLRFFCVSLLSPKNFGLITEHPPPNVARDLTLIAKVLQNLANLVEFGKKEPYMILCNKYINDNIGEMKGLLDKMSSLDEEVSNELPVKNQINWGREMARVHFHFEDNLELMKEKYPSESNEDIQILSSVLTKLDQEIENDLKLTAPTKRSKDGNNKWLESTVSQSDENNKARVKLGTKATTTSNLPTMRVRKKAFLMSSKTNVNITPTEVEEESTSWNMVKPKKPKEFED